MRKIKVVVLLVQQLQHGFTKNAKVSPNLTVAHIQIQIQHGRIYTVECVHSSVIDTVYSAQLYNPMIYKSPAGQLA